MKASLIKNVLIFTALIVFTTCDENDPKTRIADPVNIMEAPSSIAVLWADMSLYTMRYSSFNSPTYSSRSLAYLGIAMHESLVQGIEGKKSLAPSFSGLVLPQAATDLPYEWLLSLNESQRSLLKLLYPVPGNSHRFIHGRIDSLANAIHNLYAKNLAPEVIKRSEEFGKGLAEALFNWSTLDGAHEGFKYNFDPTFEFPKGDSYWEPSERGQIITRYPLHAHWGQNRMFVTANTALEIPSIVPFSTDPSSEYYKMYYDVYQKNKVLSYEEREIAAWWSDDPTETFSPPGHSYYIATLAIKSSNCKLVQATEAYARVGLAVADAFIHCWKIKFTYFNERPSSYVKKYIDPEWIQLWPEPPFPAFPSGHAIHSAATATVLTDIFGDNFSFTDNCHLGFRRYDDVRFLDLIYPSRTFSDFWDAANESALSRFLGGIHTRQDNEVAQTEGIKIGENVNRLPW